MSTMNTYEKTQIIAKAMGWRYVDTPKLYKCVGSGDTEGWVTHKGAYLDRLPDFYTSPEYAWDVMGYFGNDLFFSDGVEVTWYSEYYRILEHAHNMLQQAHAILDHTLYLIDWRDSKPHHITYTCMTCNYTTTVHCNENEIAKALEHIGYEYAAHPNHMHVIHSVITDRA